MGLYILGCQLSAILAEWSGGKKMAALICIKTIRGTFC